MGFVWIYKAESELLAGSYPEPTLLQSLFFPSSFYLWCLKMTLVGLLLCPPPERPEHWELMRSLLTCPPAQAGACLAEAHFLTRVPVGRAPYFARSLSGLPVLFLQENKSRLLQYRFSCPSVFFPDHFTQCIVPTFRGVWTLSWLYIILWIYVQVLKDILRIMCKGPVMVRRDCEVGAWCIWGSRGRPVFGAEQSVGRARNTLMDHLLTDLCPHSENQRSLLEIFPFSFIRSDLKIIFRI